MTSKNLFVAVALLLMAIVSPQAHSQWADASGDAVINPGSGEEINPSFTYNPTNGLFSIINAGNNGVVDSTDNFNLLGDDAGMIEMLISFPGQTNLMLVPELEGILADGLVWNEPQLFNNEIQLIGNAVQASFLRIQEGSTGLFFLDPGLSDADFRNEYGVVEIEMGLRVEMDNGIPMFTTGDAFETGAFQIVPEPDLGSASLLVFFLAMLKFRCRRILRIAQA